MTTDQTAQKNQLKTHAALLPDEILFGRASSMVEIRSRAESS